ncbi:fMet-Leu-Phe receptor [Biomphalaria glabrata]|nr:fMet-Leu-Phe receptor [Biomphalaria glabrata]
MSFDTRTNSVMSLKQAEGLLSDRQYLIAEGLLCLVRGSVSFLGIIGNIINIITYFSMRPNDGVTASFLVLAFSDFSYLVTMASRAVSFGFYFLEKIYNMTIWFPVEPYGVYIFFGNAGSIPYTVSILITTLLSVVRCISVWQPLKFKTMFGPKRSMYVVVVFMLFSAGTYIPVLVYMGMTDQFNGQINASRPTLWVSPKREEIKVNMWAVRDAMLPIASEFIVSSCVIVMAQSLKKTLAFRHNQSNKLKTDFFPKNISSYKKTHRPTKLIGKELQALQQVLFIALIFIICNTPKIVVNFTPYLLPDFALGQLNQNLYLTSIGVLYLFQVINSSTSVLIYYNFSSKYRKHFRICFGLL